MRRIAVLLALAAVAGPAMAGVTAPPQTVTRPYEPPKAQIEDDAACLVEEVAAKAPDPGLLLRNTCAVRVNFALCVRRSDDAKPEVTKGSLSPAAVYARDVAFTAKTKHFTHRANFCPGLTCEVAEPDC